MLIFFGLLTFKNQEAIMTLKRIDFIIPSEFDPSLYIVRGFGGEYKGLPLLSSELKSKREIVYEFDHLISLLNEMKEKAITGFIKAKEKSKTPEMMDKLRKKMQDETVEES